MKFFFLLGILLSSFTVSAKDCGSTMCFDFCTSGYIRVKGDTCDRSFSFSEGCYKSYGYCANSQGKNSCEGESKSCFDYCTGSYIRVKGDTCSRDFSFSEGCYKSYGSCSK